MNLRSLAVAGMLTAATAVLSPASAVPVSGTTTFDSNPGGILANWAHSFTLGAPGIEIQQIQIVLNANLFFDTTGAAPGFLAFQNIATTAIGGTGFTGFSATGAALNGGTSVILAFSDFDAGETYTHVGDVDEVQTLLNCSGLAPVAAAICIATNTARTLDGSLVSGAEFAGSTINVTLGGGTGPVTLTGVFVATGANTATATWTGDVPVPVPSTLMLATGALAGLGWARRRRV